MKRNLNNGTINGQITYCPVNGWDCPYYKNGICYVDNPFEDCDDWASFFPKLEEWEEL